MSSTFANRLVELRESSGVSRQQLADSIGLSRASIEYYEKDKRHPDTDTIIKIAQYFHVTTDFLLGLSITPTKNKKLSDVCDFLNLPDKTVMRLKDGSSEILAQVLDSPEFWKIIKELSFALKYKAYLKVDGNLVAMAVLDKMGLHLQGTQPRDVPKEYLDVMLAVVETGIEPIYKCSINDEMSKLFDKIVSEKKS